MNISLGLRQIFSYLLPGAVSLFILAAVSVICWPSIVAFDSKDGEWWATLAKAVGDTSLLGGLVFVLFSIAVGVISSSWFSFFIWAVSRVYGDPRAQALKKLPGEIQEILGECDTDAKRSVFYYCWSVAKLKIDKPLEFAMFGIFAMNFCARVLGIVTLSILVVLGRLVILGATLTQGAGEVALVFLLSLAGVLLFHSMRHFFSIWCIFGISLFTALFQLELSSSQRMAVMSQIHFLTEKATLSHGESKRSYFDGAVEETG